MSRRMAFGCGGLVLGAVCLGFLSLNALTIRRPVVRIVRIEVPGGVVPLRVTLFGSKDGTITPGGPRTHGDGTTLHAGPGGRMVVTRLRFSPPRFTIEFPESHGVLQLEAAEDNIFVMTGTWSRITNDGITLTRPASTNSTGSRNWFDPGPSETPDENAAFAGDWPIIFDGDTQSARLHIRVSRENAAAELTCDGISHHSFAGRVDGDLLRLASFDGAIPCLIHARLDDAGAIRGELSFDTNERRSFRSTPADGAIP